MCCANINVRDRLNQIADELIEIATGTHALSEQELAEALLVEAKRLERNAAGAAQAR